MKKSRTKIPINLFHNFCQKSQTIVTIKYLSSSIASTIISEIILLTTVGVLGANVSEVTVVATIAGGLFSYFLSRYWIWQTNNKKPMGRQFIGYWVVTVVCLIISTTTTSLSSNFLHNNSSERLILIGLTYFLTYVILWIAKYFLYQKILFAPKTHYKL